MRKGFTLIELLVVISIISLLSSIVLSALSSAREQSRKSASVQEIAQLRSEAEIIRVQTGSYDTLCDNPGKGYDLWATAVTRMEAGAISFCLDSSGTSQREYSSPEVIDDITPMAEAEKWAANVKLSNNEWFCVDYTGFAGITTSSTIAGAGPDRDC